MSITSLRRKTRKVFSGAAKAVRRGTDPTSIITDKIIDTAVPGFSSTMYKTFDPTYTAEVLNPLKTPMENLNKLQSELLDTGKKAKQVVVPDRESYSASASKGAAEAAKRKAAFEAEQKKMYADLTADAEAKAAAQSAAYGKWKAEQAAKAAEATSAAAEAEKPSTEATAAQQAATIQQTAPGEVRVIIDAAYMARDAAMQEQYLPEVYVESDFKKYLVIGGFALAAIWFLTRKKKG